MASTSYRAQGRVVVEGVKDVLQLREWAVARLGGQEGVRLCVLEGRSMGGAIGTLVAEGQHGSEGLFDGVVAVGAALMVSRGWATGTHRLAAALETQCR